jgi:transposase
MGYIVGEARGQQTLFPVALEDLIGGDHFCRVIDAFVAGLDFVALGFERAQAAETGRPGYDPRDLLKLYLYGYLQQVRWSRRLEAECRRNVEVMWLLGRLAPDYKSIAEFRRLHVDAVTEAGAELVRFARSVGLVRGEWVAIDGSKFQAVASARRVAERESVKRYLESVEAGDQQEEATIDAAAVAAALAKLKNDPEPEAGFMRTAHGKVPAYNVQTAVDAAHALIVAQQVTTHSNDRSSLQPMAEAAHTAVGEPAVLNVVADAGYSNGAQAEACEARGIVPHVPAQRSKNTHGAGKLFDRSQFVQEPGSDTLLCPAGQRLERQRVRVDKQAVVYAADKTACAACAIKGCCTTSAQRTVFVSLHQAALERMNERATAERMRLRRCTVEHPFGTLKYRIFGNPRFLLRGIAGATVETGLGIMAYNLKRMINVLGGGQMAAALAP